MSPQSPKRRTNRSSAASISSQTSVPNDDCTGVRRIIQVEGRLGGGEEVGAVLHNDTPLHVMIAIAVSHWRRKRECMLREGCQSFNTSSTHRPVEVEDHLFFLLSLETMKLWYEPPSVFCVRRWRYECVEGLRQTCTWKPSSDLLYDIVLYQCSLIINMCEYQEPPLYTLLFLLFYTVFVIWTEWTRGRTSVVYQSMDVAFFFFFCILILLLSNQSEAGDSTVTGISW